MLSLHCLILCWCWCCVPAGFVPYAGEGFALLLPSKWNPSREQDFPGTILRSVRVHTHLDSPGPAGGGALAVNVQVWLDLTSLRCFRFTVDLVGSQPAACSAARPRFGWEDAMQC